jgi:aminoglycoside phosphotransferase (APT) family kinase protein
VTRAAEETRGVLERWFADRLSEAAGRRVEVDVAAPERPAGGRSNDTSFVDVSWSGAPTRGHARWVVRVQPATDHIFRRPDVVREATVLRGLAAASTAPVPRVRWIEPDARILGAPFFVMDHVPGRVPLARPSIHAAGWLPTLTRRELERVWRSALETVAAVHATDWRSHHAFLLDGAQDACADAHVQRLADWYHWTTDGREHPITDAALADVQARVARVDDSIPVLVWGDARVGNMIFGDDQRVAAAIDWETAAIGPPEIDVAHWLFFDEFATSACGVDPLPGWPDRAQVVTTYESLTARSLHHLDLFQTIDELFMATTLIRQADARVARGLAPENTRMGHDNTVTQMLARRLGLPVPELSPDYVAHRGGTS